MNGTPFKIIQISDTHLYADKTKALLGVNTEDSFQAVLNLLQQENGKMDLILLTGDLAQDGSSQAYKRVADALKPFSVPVYCVPGNHDNAKTMKRVYPYEPISDRRRIVLKQWQIILLNSQLSGAVEGYLESSELSYLEHCLRAHPHHQAMIAFHHQPLPVGSAWLDKIGLKNAKKFWEVIAAYPQVNTVLFGHVHQEFTQIVKGVKCYSAPATCFQFERNNDHFALEKLPPGYRRIYLHEKGEIETSVHRVSEYVGHFDAHCKGY